jgi:DNA-binding NarL/FixJ family response regulator
MTLFHSLLAWIPTTLLVLGVPGVIYLYLSLKIELRLATRRAVTRAELDARFTELVTDLETLRVRLALAETRPTPTDWSPQAVNLNRRGQVLRLHGKGRTPAEIASDLQISRGEVELLIKVQEWSPASVL